MFILPDQDLWIVSKFNKIIIKIQITEKKSFKNNQRVFIYGFKIDRNNQKKNQLIHKNMLDL